jgi:hypothetical protein
MSLTAAQLESLDSNGFLSFESLVSARSVAELRSVYDRILAHDIAAEGDRWLGGVTRQVMFPSKAHPLFDDNEARDMSRGIARAAFDGAEPVFAFDQLLFKPPGHPVETPWHQDMAYSRMPFSPKGYPCRARQILQFWIALDAADAENGCMHFVPGRHREPLLEHYVVSGAQDYEGRLLGIVDPERTLDLTTAVACPVPAGGATLHLAGTPHYTPPNRSVDRPRRAYIINYVHPALFNRGRSTASG